MFLKFLFYGIYGVAVPVCSFFFGGAWWSWIGEGIRIRTCLLTQEGRLEWEFQKSIISTLLLIIIKRKNSNFMRKVFYIVFIICITGCGNSDPFKKYINSLSQIEVPITLRDDAQVDLSPKIDKSLFKKYL